MAEIQLDKQPSSRKGKPWGTPFKKGQSGNPNGRPKKERTLINIAEAMLKEKVPLEGHDELMAQALVKQWLINCLKGNAPLFKELLDRLYGKAPEHITLEGGEKPLTFKVIHDNDKD